MTADDDTTRRITLGVVVLGRERPGFDPDWGQAVLAAAKSALEGLDHEVVYAGEQAVDNGSLRAAVNELSQAGADTLVALQPTMADGRLAPILARLCDP